jgi:hypothetical protein
MSRPSGDRVIRHRNTALWFVSREDQMQPCAPLGGPSHVGVERDRATRVSDGEMDGEATGINMQLDAPAATAATGPSPTTNAHVPHAMTDCASKLLTMHGMRLRTVANATASRGGRGVVRSMK